MLEISHLSTRLVGPVSVSVEPGECVAILGPSGSGKSLLLRAIADLDPNEGSLSFGGRDRGGMPAYEWRKLVAMVPAESGWWADRVAEHFAPCPGLAALLQAVGLPQALDWEVARLSTGERHRLAIVRALGTGPRALLLDEPTAALDEEAARRVEGLIRQQCRDGVAVLLVTHDRDQAARLAGRCLAMERGRLSPMPGARA